MFDLIPWLDETYIVEMGRLFLCGGCGDTTLLGQGNVSLLPMCYLGPLIQECLFRLFGVLGVRISPFVGLALAGCAFYWWLRRQGELPRPESILLGIAVGCSPLLFQSALLTRVDTWALGFLFISWASLAGRRTRVGLALSALFALLSFLVWPTASVFAFAYVIFFARDFKRSQLLCFAGFLIGFSGILLIPIAPYLPEYVAAFARHYGEVTSPPHSVTDVILPLMREVSRSPLTAVLSVLGIVSWIRSRRYIALSMTALAFVIAARAGLYTFRIVYLTPFLYLAVSEAVRTHRVNHPRAIRYGLWAMALYGVLTGPVGHFVLDYPTLPTGLKENLADCVGVGPIRVFAPDHATYYISRELGWTQLGFARPSDAEDVRILSPVLESCDFVVLRDFDPYEPFQQSCTPYGLFCKYVLKKAKDERDLPEDHKSRAARFGSRFSFAWHQPLLLNGFVEVGRWDMIRVFGRIGVDTESDNNSNAGQRHE